MSTEPIISYNDPATNNRGRSIIDLDTYRNDAFSVHGYALENLLEDVILVEYKDTADGRDVLRNGIVIPTAHVKHTWRIAYVHLAGTNCKTVKVGDHVCFPSDKGIPVSGVTILDPDKKEVYLKNACFLSEGRIFGVCKKLAGANKQ